MIRSDGLTPENASKKLQRLTLVVRARARPVEHARPLGHALVDEAADDLAVLQDEGHVAGADLEHRARARPARAGMAEAGIEEAGVVDPELADQRIEGHHLGGVIRRHVHRLLGGQDVELAGVEDEGAGAVGGSCSQNSAAG